MAGSRWAAFAVDSGPMDSEALVRVKRLRASAKLPFRASEHASGFDLYACVEEPVVLGQRPKLVGTGLALEVPPGLDAQIRPRSGLARQGVLSTFGTLDADYRGELMIALYTTAPDVTYVVHDGDRIAQIVVTRLADVAFAEAEELSDTARGAGGHGSTGR
jgi:dUTP pyrophosphatase